MINIAIQFLPRLCPQKIRKSWSRFSIVMKMSTGWIISFQDDRSKQKIVVRLRFRWWFYFLVTIIVYSKYDEWWPSLNQTMDFCADIVGSTLLYTIKISSHILSYLFTAILELGSPCIYYIWKKYITLLIVTDIKANETRSPKYQNKPLTQN